MLIDEPEALRTTTILDLIARMNGGGKPARLDVGIYEIGHFGSSGFLKGYNHYPRITTSPYGVADSVQQILEANPELIDLERKFVLTINHVRRSQQSSEGGWRWCKWGPYIGTKKPQEEYLYDEPEIEEVFVYQIYEKIVED